jgi:hypothetical protein
MKNPAAAGWYWVWRLAKDIDRNISAAVYWGPASDPCGGAALGTGWHDPDDTTFADGGQPHAREFAAWAGPLADRLPPETPEEQEVEYARSRAAAGVRASKAVRQARTGSVGPVHVKGCELGDNWRDCPACVAARAGV